MFAILKRGIRPDVEVEVAADMLGGSVIMRVLLTGDAMTPRIVRRVGDTILDVIAFRS